MDLVLGVDIHFRSFAFLEYERQVVLRLKIPPNFYSLQRLWSPDNTLGYSGGLGVINCQKTSSGLPGHIVIF